MIEDFNRIFREKLAKRLFGEEWRPSAPLENLSAEFGVLMLGLARDERDYWLRAGKMKGLIEALDIVKETLHELSTDPQKRGND